MRLIEIAARNVRRNTRRSVLSGAATAVATMAICLLLALIAGMDKDYGGILSTYVSGHIRVRHAEYDALEHLNPVHLRLGGYEEMVRVLESDERIDRASPRIQLPAMLYQADAEEQRGMQVTGVDFVAEAEGMKLEQYLIEGSLPAPGDRGAVIGARLAQELDLRVGDIVTLLAQTVRRDANAVSFTVRGLVNLPLATLNLNTVFVPLDGAQRLGRMGPSVTEILVTLVDDSKAEALTNEVASLLAPFEGPEQPISVKNWKEIDLIYGFFGVVQIIYGFAGMIFFLLASTVLINTTMMVINERTREIGTIGAMGMKGSEIVRLFFMEGLIIAAIGAGVGILLGTAFILPLQNFGIDMSAAIEGTGMKMPGIIYPQFNALTLVLVWIYAVVVTGITALIPSRRAATIEPVEALRYQG